MTGIRAVLFSLLLLGILLLFGVRSLQAGDTWNVFQNNEPPVSLTGARVPFEAGTRCIRLRFGLRDSHPMDWSGSLRVSGGLLVGLRGRDLGAGDRAEGSGWRLVSRPRPAPGVAPPARTGGGIPDEEETEGDPEREELPAPAVPEIVAEIQGGDATRCEVATPEGAFAFTLGEVPPGAGARLFLAGAAAAEGAPGYAQVTSTPADEDYPAGAASTDGSVWIAYIAYEHGPPVVQAEIRAGRFDSLVPSGNGDQVRLTRWDGKTWSPAANVSDRGLDIWRPTVAIDGQGQVWTVWAQGAAGNWDLYARSYDPAGGKLAPVRRLTTAPGTDTNPVAATDARGRVWIAWQGWRNGSFDVWAAPLGTGALRPQAVASTPRNEWHPAIAAAPNGDLWIGWDTYARGDYDVMVRRLSNGSLGPPVAVAASPRFEARPSLAADRAGRLWVGFEDASPNWGKDYGSRWDGPSGEQFYLQRFIRVRCVDGGQVRETARIPIEPTNTTYPRGQNVRAAFPRLGIDGQGCLWLLFRRHPAPNAQGERWVSHAARYDGDRWSTQIRLPESENLLDNRPALATVRAGLLTVYSGDGRTGGTNSMRENNLFSTVLASAAPVREPVLTAVNPAGDGQKVEPVHPEETADIGRVRAFRLRAGGKSYRLLRGEFHRHTEISSHRDQDGPFEEIWRYGLDVARMDWIGPGDHDNGAGQEYTWWITQKQCAMYSHSPTFIPMFTYERSVVFPSGHRNVMFAKRGIRPLPRLAAGGGAGEGAAAGEGGGAGQGGGAGGGMGARARRRQQLMFGTPEAGSPDIKNLYAYLKHFDGICSSHTSATNMGTDWRDNDPQVETVVEVFQGHRQNYEEPNAPKAPKGPGDAIGGYQPAGFVWNAFGKGYRLGFQVSSDHVSTHISYAVALAENTSREAILDAFKKRHTYGANDNIVLSVRCGEHLMGDEFDLAALPALDIAVEGTGSVTRVDIVRQTDRETPAYVYTTEPGRRNVRLRWTDTAPKKGAVNMYYVRIIQQNGGMAWASPMWVHYQ